MLASVPIVSFVATAEPAKARAFYEGVLGLRFVKEDGHALVFEAAGRTLRITKVKEVHPQPFTVLGWEVSNVHDTVAELTKRGVQFERYGFFEQDALGIWAAPSGDKIAWFKDRDGNTLSVSQHV
jgi:catechol 2,3-dioxygenase-like lactoylglutathione lyase family enzyme